MLEVALIIQADSETADEIPQANLAEAEEIIEEMEVGLMLAACAALDKALWTSVGIAVLLPLTTAEAIALERAPLEMAEETALGTAPLLTAEAIILEVEPLAMAL